MKKTTNCHGISPSLLFVCFFFLTSLPNLSAQDDANQIVDKFVNLARNQVRSNIDSVVFYMDKAIEKAKVHQLEERIGGLLREKGYYFEIYNRLEYALEMYREALEYAKNTQNVALTLDLYTDLAISNRKNGSYEAAKNHHLAALELAQTEDDSKNIEYSLHGLGYLYETIGDYELAIIYYLQSLDIAEKRAEKPGVITTLQNIATTYAKIGNHELAQKTIKKAYKLSLEVGDSSAITKVLHDHGTILLGMKEYDEALDKFLISLKINQLRMSKGTIARSLMYIAETYMKKRQFEVAERYLSDCLNYKEVMRDEDLAELYNKLGQLFFTKREYQKAREAFLSSLKIAEKQDYATLIQQNNHKLYEVGIQENETAVALYHLEKSTALKDSIFNAEQTTRMAELQFRYDTEKSEKQIHALKSKQHKMMLVGSSALFAGLILFMGFLIRIKTKSNRTLKLKNIEIQQQNVKLKESNEVLQQFAYVAAHDLKEPLRSIGSFVNLFQRKYGKQFNEEANEYMNFVRNGVHHMNDLLTDLLQYSTISIQKPTNEIMDMQAILSNVVKNLRVPIESKNAQLQFSADLPNLRMNELHATQLFQNLISNGLKFTQQTPIIHIDGKQEGEQITFSIHDNGNGINAKYSDKIYKLFHQLDRTVEGRGIGLTICKNIVDKYNGKIWFESNEKKGTRFFVSFPKQVAA